MIKWASGFVDGEGYIQYKQEPYKIDTISDNSKCYSYDSQEIRCSK